MRNRKGSRVESEKPVSAVEFWREVLIEQMEGQLRIEVEQKKVEHSKCFV